MSDKVQEAITATRAGEKRNAQVLLTEELQENPDNEHAWFLLGNLVDSPEKRMAYLGQTLAINPQHAKARQQFSQIYHQQTAESTPTTNDLSAQPTGVLVQEDKETRVIDDTLAMPDWLADELKDDDLEEIPANIVEAPTSTKIEPTTTKAMTTTETAVDKNERERQLKRYNQILTVLVVAAVIVLLALIWSLLA